jgi:hypothetical protein
MICVKFYLLGIMTRQKQPCPLENDWKERIAPKEGGRYTMTCNLCGCKWTVSEFNEKTVQCAYSEHLPFCDFINQMILYVQSNDWAKFK